MSEQPRDTQPAPRFLRFSTQGIAPVSRLPLWEGHNAKALISLDIRSIVETPLHASEVNLHLPYLRLAQVRGSAQVVERSESFIREHPTDVVAVFFALEGDAFFYHRGGHESLQPGQAVMYDADLPFMRGFSRGLEELVLTVPRSLYEELSGGTSLNRPVVFDFGPGARAEAHALACLVRRALAPPEPGHGPATPPQDLERSALELFRMLVAGRSAGSGAGYLAAATAHIERNLGDPELSTPQIAATVGISERQLARAFADAGTTVREFLRARRLDRAREILTSAAGGGSTLGELSAALGFRSQNYFGRAFKDRFGRTPLDVRREARAALLLDPGRDRE